MELQTYISVLGDQKTESGTQRFKLDWTANKTSTNKYSRDGWSISVMLLERIHKDIHRMDTHGMGKVETKNT